MEKFGIFSPYFGIRQDFPSILLSDAYSPEGQNIQFKDGVAKSYAREVIEFGSDPVNMPDNSLILAYHTHKYGASNAELLFAATKWNIYKWNSGTNEWVSAWRKMITPFFSDNTEHSTGGGSIVIEGDVTDTNDYPEYAVGQKLSYYISITNTMCVLTIASATYEEDVTVLGITGVTDIPSDEFSLFIGEITTPCTRWSIASFNDNVLATNGVDAPIMWTPLSDFATINITGPEIATGLHITKAKEVTVYNNYAILGNYETSDSSVYSHGIAWSSLGDPTQWETGAEGSDAGQAAVEGDGIISGFGRKADLLYVFKTKSIRKYWFTGSELIFASVLHANSTGTEAPGSIVNDAEGNLYFYGSDMTFREVDFGDIGQAINIYTRSINPSKFSIISATFIEELKELWWAVPEGQSAINNMVYTFNKGVWSVLNMGVGCFGRYSRTTSWTWATLPFSSWSEWNWPTWDYSRGQTGFPVNIACDNGTNGWEAGTTWGLLLKDIAGYETPNQIISYLSTDITAEIVLVTDFTKNQALSFYKRLLAARFYFQNTINSQISVYVATDDSDDWKYAGNISAAYTSKIQDIRLAMDYKSRSFKIKISSDYAFELIGIVFDYVSLGDRR